jgi:glycosyltransferase involved in cell wall biosynthesis
MAGRQAGGPETYEHCLVRALAEVAPRNEYYVYCLSRPAADSFGAARANVRYHVLWPRLRWVSIAAILPIALRAAKLDVFHATFVPPPFAVRDYVFTMHDDSMFRHPEFYPPAIRWRLQNLVRRGLKRARLVLCISESVRASVAEAFRLPEERLAVVYHGVDPRFGPRPLDLVRRELAQRYGLHEPYTLFVGRLTARKNPVRMLEAFHRFRQEAKCPVKLVLAGNRSWTAEGFDEAMTRLGLQDSVIELGHVPDEDLPWLYCGALMLVFPSLWEGFGLPVIEAMASGTPVITSNVSSLPEVAGDAAVLVDPYSTDAIGDAMTRVFQDPGLRETLRARGLERARRFVWGETARQTLAAYTRARAGAAAGAEP